MGDNMGPRIGVRMGFRQDPRKGPLEGGGYVQLNQTILCRFYRFCRSRAFVLVARHSRKQDNAREPGESEGAGVQKPEEGRLGRQTSGFVTYCVSCAICPS